MSDQISKKSRSVINPLRSINKLRISKGLPKISNRPKLIKVLPEQKLEITRQEIDKLFPGALTDVDYKFTEEQGKKLVKAVEERIQRIKAGKEDVPAVEKFASKEPKKAAKAPVKKAPKVTEKKII